MKILLSFLLLFLVSACSDGAQKEPHTTPPATVGVDAPYEKQAQVRDTASLPQQQLASAGIPDTLLVQQESGDTLRSAQVISGKARGFYFFEAQFLLRVFDSSGRQLAMAPATADGDWMTTDWVPFSGRLSWKNYSGPGKLVFEKANPSDDRERDRSYSVPLLLVGAKK